MNPYRTLSPPSVRDVSAPARWFRAKRAIADLHPSLCAHAWFRRWAGGRWAECALVSPRMLTIVGSAVSGVVETRWRPVDDCPHNHWVRIYDGALVGMAPHCTCEEWP